MISVNVYGEPTLTQAQIKVLPGGSIVEPLVGPVRVGGLTPREASRAVALALMHYVRAPKVTVAVEALGPLSVYVLGAVKNPGKYELQPASRVMDALAAAGGLGEIDGDLPDARVADGNAMRTVSLQRLLHGGDLSQNVVLADGDSIYVPSPVTFNIQVFGAVDKPGDVQLHEGDRLVVAIARAGASPNVNPDLNRVTLRRPDASGTVRTQTYNLYEIYKSGDLTKDPVLQKGDVVYVPQSARHGDISPTLSILRWFIP